MYAHVVVELTRGLATTHGIYQNEDNALEVVRRLKEKSGEDLVWIQDGEETQWFSKENDCWIWIDSYKVK